MPSRPTPESRPARHALARLLPAAATLALAAAAALSGPAAAADANGCARYASPGGSDSAAGTAASPYRTVVKLLSSLNAGETGCLRGGTYQEDVRVPRGGTAGAPVTLTSYPGERARVVGRFWIPRGSDYVTVTNLDLDGANSSVLPSPTVNSVGATFEGNDVFNENTTICFNLGNSSYGRAVGTVIRRNRIHNCGVLPPQNHHHGIYVANADDTQILGNFIYNNADRGIQLYPDAQRTTIKGNVIDGNGEGIIFSGDGGVASNDNVVSNNVITNSTVRYNVESWYPSGNPIGQGNVANHNCISGGVRAGSNGGIASQWGFTASDNLNVDPAYANRAAGDFSVPASNPCAQILAGAGVDTPITTGTTPDPTGSSDSSSGSSSTSGTSSGTTGSDSGGVPITLKGHRGKSGRLALRARVARGTLRAAGFERRRVTIQLRRHGVWRTIASGRLQQGGFRRTLRLPRSLRRRAVVLRAVVPSVGRSKPVRFRP